MRDPWSESAKHYYDDHSRLKGEASRYRKFTRSYRKITKIINLRPDSSLLDMGCGCGEMAQALKEHVANYYGVDVSWESLKVARRLSPFGIFILADMTSFSTTGCFDAVTAVSSLEFCYDKVAAMRQMHRALRDSGRLYIEVRNADFLLFKLFAPFLGLLKHFGMITPYEAEGFRDLFMDEWCELLERSGFKIIKKRRSIRPAMYGTPITRLKNLCIKFTSLLTPKKYHYLVGFVCVKE